MESTKDDEALFVPPGHYYSPITTKSEVAAHLDRVDQDGVPETLPGLNIDKATIERRWRELARFMTAMNFPEHPNDEYRYGWQNDFYGIGDALIFSSMIQLYRPKKIIEVGCGWSSAVALDTIEKQLGGGCSITFIEPNTERLNQVVPCMPAWATVIASPIQDVPLKTFGQLEENDILFIDSTHVVKTGSDVCHEVFNILPTLKPGVIVHFHDIFWPFEYPRQWAQEQSRSWNELYLLRALLMHSTAWRVVMFNHYAGVVMPEVIASTEPRALQNIGGGLWLKRI